MSTVPTVAVESFHLPGKHEQESHGRRSGSGSAGGSSSKGSNDAKAKAPTKAAPLDVADVQKYYKKYDKSAGGRKAFAATPLNSRSEIIKAADDNGGEINGYSKTEIFDALAEYSSASRWSPSTDLSRNLRQSNGNLSQLSAEAQKDVAALDAMFNASSITKDINVRLGLLGLDANKVFGDAWRSDGNNAGLTWTNHDYTEVTAKQSLGTHFDNGGQNMVQLNILVPKGKGAVGTEFTAGKAMASNGDGSMLLQRGLQFRIVSDSGVSPTSRRPRQVFVEVIN